MSNALGQKLEECQRRNCQVGFAIGSFGLVHAGTVHFLRQAREKCDCLFAVILAESASSAAQLLRPEERVRLLDALQEVDHAVLVQEGNLAEYLKLAPDALWFCSKSEADVETEVREVLARSGANLHQLPGDETCTTAALLQRMASGTGSPKRG